MRIAISSRSGCGNTTVTKLVSERLGYPMINFTFRQMAKERGVDFWEFCRLAEKDYEIDKELDRRQVEMAMAVPDCVLGSRLAIWMLEKADLKVYLTASAETRARRIQKREGGSYDERYSETMGALLSLVPGKEGYPGSPICVIVDAASRLLSSSTTRSRRM